MSEIAAVMTDMGLFNDALVWHYKAINAKPDSHDAWEFLGITYVNMGRMNDALHAFERAESLKPDSASVHYHLGNVMRSMDAEKAAAHYETALKLNPEYFEAMIDLANLYDDMGIKDKALRLYNDGIRRFPERPEGYYNLRVFFERSGDLRAAAVNYTKALTLDPDYQEPAEGLKRMGY